MRRVIVNRRRRGAVPLSNIKRLEKQCDDYTMFSCKACRVSLIVVAIGELAIGLGKWVAGLCSLYVRVVRVF